MLRKLMWVAVLVLIAVFGLAGGIMAQEDEGDTIPIRAIWSSESFVIINTSDEGVDLSTLRFESILGELNPDAWVMNFDANTGVVYDLIDVRPGSCLVAALGTSQPSLPPNVFCTRIIGQTVLTTLDDVIWSIPQGGFTPYLDEEALTSCSIRNTSCDLEVSPAYSSISSQTQEPETLEIRAIWTQQVLVLINTTGRGADLSTLRLESAEGAITPDDWTLDFSPDLGDFYTLNNLRPGSCLVAYMGTNRPELPNTITCTRIVGRYILRDAADKIWDAAHGGFTASLDGFSAIDNDADESDSDEEGTAQTEPVTCSIQRTSCTLFALNADFSADQVEISFVWDFEVFVIMNDSNRNVDLSGLRLSGLNGSVEADGWALNEDTTLNRIPPGSCLIAYLNLNEFDQLPIPSGADCSNIVGQQAVTNANDIIWRPSQVEFTVSIDEDIIATCTVADRLCTVSIPMSQSN